MTPRHEPPPWLDRAQEAHIIAARSGDPEARRTMLRIADNYEALARAYDLLSPSCRDPVAPP